METRHVPRPRPNRASILAEIDHYRVVVNDVFAHHRKVCGPNSRTRCVCGGAWPCPAEQLAAQLLDWVS